MPTVHDLCFDADWYLSNYKDVAASAVDPYTHYLKLGRFEGRKPCAKNATPHMIAWESARRAAAQEDWFGAQTVLNAFQLRALLKALRHPDATILVLEILTMNGFAAQAQKLLDDALADFGPHPALALAQSAIRHAISPDDPSWANDITPAFPKNTKLTLTDGPKPALDRLTASAPKLRMIRSQPKVTVIVPVLNAAETLETALESLTTQTWKNLEILVVDNGSTDGSPQVAECFCQKDSRVSMLDASHDPGAYPARNMGLAAASGAFVTVLDADDWAHPEKIARQAKALMKSPSSQASLSDWARATPDLRFTNTRDDITLIHSNISSLMIKASLRETLGFWDRVQADADTEYHRRVVHSFGADAVVRVLPGLLLSIGRSQGGSLSRMTPVSADADNPRQIYQNSAAAWHASAPTPYLGQHPKSRPFPAPDTLTKGIKPR